VHCVRRQLAAADPGFGFVSRSATAIEWQSSGMGYVISCVCDIVCLSLYGSVMSPTSGFVNDVISERKTTPMSVAVPSVQAVVVHAFVLRLKDQRSRSRSHASQVCCISDCLYIHVDLFIHQLVG